MNMFYIFLRNMISIRMHYNMRCRLLFKKKKKKYYDAIKLFQLPLFEVNGTHIRHLNLIALFCCWNKRNIIYEWSRTARRLMGPFVSQVFPVFHSTSIIIFREGDAVCILHENSHHEYKVLYSILNTITTNLYFHVKAE